MTLGVEEEFLVVDAATGDLVPRSDELVPRARTFVGPDVSPELNLCQIEIGTPVCTELDEVRRELSRLRRSLSAAGRPLGLQIAATGTHPSTTWRRQRIDPTDDRYLRMGDAYQVIARQQVICGCHVHVGIEPEMAVPVMTAVRAWLAPLLALSANSPFWRSQDTGYASYRMEVWQRWPTSGMPPALDDQTELDALVADLVAIGAIEDATYLYWYVRPSIRYPTLEFRICDVCLDVEDTVAVAGVVRALAWTTCRAVRAGRAGTPENQEVLAASVWRAGRYGLDDRLVSPTHRSLEPAAVVAGELLAHVREGLEAHGDWEMVSAWVEHLLAVGNGARRQREAHLRRGRVDDVVERIVRETVPS